MDFVDELRRAREARPAVWIQFTTVYRPGDQNRYFFFEGKDDCAYYLPELRRRFCDKGDPHWFVCAGKTKLIELVARVLREVDQPCRALFFVDKDHDDLTGVRTPVPPEVFETKWYSIENYLVEASSLLAIWSDLLALPASDRRWPLVREKFEAEHRRFCRLMLGPSAWVIAVRRLGIRPNLNNVDMRRLAHVDGKTLAVRSRRKRLFYLEESTGVPAGSVRWTELRKGARELVALHPKAYVRGKWELWFFVELVRALITALAEKAGAGERVTLRTQLGAENAVQVLAARHGYPEELFAYLERRSSAGT